MPQLTGSRGRAYTSRVSHKVQVVQRCGVKITRVDKARRVVFGEVMIPAPEGLAPGATVRKSELEGAIHFDGAFMRAAEIQSLAYAFARKRPSVDVEHDGIPRAATVVESSIVREASEVFKLGAWFVGVQIHDDQLWGAVEREEIRAFSIQFVVRVVDMVVQVVDDAAPDAAPTPVQLFEFTHGDPQFLSLVRNPATGALWKFVERAAVPSADLPVVERAWDAAAAFERVRTWAEAEPERAQDAFAVYSPGDPGRSVQLADVVGDRLVVVRSALAAAETSLAGLPPETAGRAKHTIEHYRGKRVEPDPEEDPMEVAVAVVEQGSQVIKLRHMEREVQVGDGLLLGSAVYRVDSIADDGSVTIDRAWPSESCEVPEVEIVDITAMEQQLDEGDATGDLEADIAATPIERRRGLLGTIKGWLLGADRSDGDDDSQTLTRAIVPFQDLPFADRERSWDGSAAAQRVFERAGGDEFDPDEARRGFVVQDTADPDVRASYKLGIADVVDGELRAVLSGIFAAAARRDQTDLPEGDTVDQVEGHLGRYYTKARESFDDDTIVAPWEGERSAEGTKAAAAIERSGETVVAVGAEGDHQIVWSLSEAGEVQRHVVGVVDNGDGTWSILLQVAAPPSDTTRGEDDDGGDATDDADASGGDADSDDQTGDASGDDADDTVDRGQGLTFGANMQAEVLGDRMWDAFHALMQTFRNIADSDAVDRNAQMKLAITDFGTWATGLIDAVEPAAIMSALAAAEATVLAHQIGRGDELDEAQVAALGELHARLTEAMERATSDASDDDPEGDADADTGEVDRSTGADEVDLDLVIGAVAELVKRNQAMSEKLAALTQSVEHRRGVRPAPATGGGSGGQRVSEDEDPKVIMRDFFRSQKQQ